MLNFLTENLVMVTLVALAVIIFLVLMFLVRVALKHGAPGKQVAVASAPALIQIDSLKQSFKRAIELIENNLAERAERYNLSWTLVINGGPGNEELPLLSSGLQSALSSDSAISASVDGISWNFFDKGVAVQLQSSQLGDVESKGSQSVWDEFLGLCRGYRPDRPFDALVLTVPASMLMHADAEGANALVTMAKALNRRLWLAQNRFALQFPVYLVVQGCEQIQGFARFASSLPAPMRRSMLGWSTPFDLSAPFQPRWIDTGMDEITGNLADACMELSALEMADKDSAEYFLLPSEIDKVRAGLHVFMEEFMRPSAYHEPFMFRGFYLSGDCSESAALLNVDHLPQSQTQTQAQPIPGTVRSAVEPAFLRDLFEKKVFAETGLVRSSRSQKMRRPAVHTAARWGAGILVTAWLGGIGFAALRINYVANDLVGVINQFNQESRDALRRGREETFDLEKSRARALRALRILDQLDAGALWAVTMPGSWSMVDDLNLRVQRRIADGFAQTAFDPIRLSLNSAIAEMTGASLDPTTGSLVPSAICSLPKNWAEKMAASNQKAIDFEELSEFALMQQYVARAEELQRAMAAFNRLTDRAQPASGDDLRYLVKVLLGVELNGNIGQIAAIFRSSVSSNEVLDTAALRQATSCTFGLIFDGFTNGLLANNNVLMAESQYPELLAQVISEPTSGFNGTLGIQAWENLAVLMRDEAALLQPGKGAWIQRRAPQFGVSFDKFIQRVRGIELIGSEAVDAALKRLGTSFTQFLTDWDAIYQEASSSAVSGLVWDEKEGRWAFSPERLALQDALNKMLAQPYLKNNTPRKLTEVSRNGSVTWERQRLDQALAFADVKRSFDTDLLLKFPAPMQASVSNFVHGALAAKVIESTSQAMSPSVRGPGQIVVQEAEQTRLSRLVALFNDLGATDAATTLNGIISRDALARLKLLDDSLTQANLFVPRDPEFKAWTGSGSPVAMAFEATDAAGLSAYVAQQVAFIESAAKDAELLLQVLSGLQANHPLVQRWVALSTDVARNKLKSPTSSLGALTQFVLAAGADMDTSNCSERLAKAASGRRSFDVFSDRLQALQSGLMTRCQALKANERKEAWGQFATAFNRDLAGRSPFKNSVSAAPAGALATLSRLESPPADLDDVAALLTLFDRANKVLGEPSTNVAASGATARAVPSTSATAAAASTSASVRKFAEQFVRVRQLLAPLFPTEEGVAAGYDLSVEFRANSADESEGSKIIDWALTSGTQTLRARDPAKSLFWEPGQTLSLSLRVAKDSPLAPKADAKQTDMSVDDRTVTYRFNDPWALFSFITSHREPDRASRSDVRTQLLRFEFPMAGQVDEGKPVLLESQARVFIRLGLSPVGKKTLLSWPSPFPVKAPEWSAP